MVQLPQQNRTHDSRLQGWTRTEFSWRPKSTTTKIKKNPSRHVLVPKHPTSLEIMLKIYRI